MSSTSPRRLTSLLAVCTIAGSLCAQRPVFTVGGVSPNFTSLPAAVAAVPAGAILVVRPGVHTGFATNKPLRVLLDFDAGSGSIQPAPGANYTIAINNLLAGDEFVLVGRGAAIVPGALGSMRIFQAASPVVIEGITMTVATLRSGLEIQNAPAVHVRRSVLSGIPALQVEFANFSISESVVLGQFGIGAVVADSRFEGVRTFFSGTNQPALRFLNSVARLSSDGSTVINSVAPPTAALSPLEAFDSQLQFDPARIGLVPVGTYPPLTSLFSLLLSDEVPTLVSSPAPPGLPATVRMTSHMPRIGAVVLGETLPAPALFQFTNIWVNTINAPLVVAVGLCDSLGLTTQVAIPSSPVLRGVVWCTQGVVWNPDGWPVLSGPALLAVL